MHEPVVDSSVASPRMSAFLCDVACGIELLSTHKNLLRTPPTHRSKDASALRGGSGSRVQLTEPFGVGVWRDVKNMRQTYTSHILDGLNLKVISAIAFLFFGCLSPAVAFGALCDALERSSTFWDFVGRPST